MKCKSKFVIGALVAAVVMPAAADTHYLKPNVSDWTNLANYWDGDKYGFPEAGDHITNCSTVTNYVEYGTASWDLFQKIGYFKFERDLGTLIITIPEGVCATNATPIGSATFNNCGTVVKRGKGVLVYYNTDKEIDSSGLSGAFVTKYLRIEEGDLMMP